MNKQIHIMKMSDQKTPWTHKSDSDNNCIGAVIAITYNKRTGLGGPRNCAILQFITWKI